MAKKDSDFYKRMLEAKKLKKQKIEQEQLQAEFQIYPERFLPPIVIKSSSDIKMDKAFEDLKQKLVQERQSKESSLDKAIRHIEEKQQGI